MSAQTKAGWARRFPVDEDGDILYGRFQGQKLFIPYFWQMLDDGEYSEARDGTYGFVVGDEDIAIFPELAEVAEVLIAETEDGTQVYEVDPEDLMVNEPGNGKRRLT